MQWIMGMMLAAAFLMAGCGRRGDSITLAGSTAFQPFAEKLADQFMQAHPEARVTVQGGGSAVGVQSALSGAADIGMADLVTLPPEAAGLSQIVAARDGIAVVVHPDNPVGGLTLDQVRALFNGAMTNWREVGGPDAPVTVVSREAGSGTRTSFEEIVGQIKLSPAALIQDSNGTIRETVANDRNALGYLSHGLINDRIKPVTVDGYECSNEAIKRGDYKVVRPIFLLTRGEPQGLAGQFIAYIRSAEGQRTIETSGLIPAN